MRCRWCRWAWTRACWLVGGVHAGTILHKICVVWMSFILSHAQFRRPHGHTTRLDLRKRLFKVQLVGMVLRAGTPPPSCSLCISASYLVNPRGFPFPICAQGRRPDYRSTLLALREHLELTCSENLGTADLETEVFLHLTNNCLEYVQVCLVMFVCVSCSCVCVSVCERDRSTPGVANLELSLLTTRSEALPNDPDHMEHLAVWIKGFQAALHGAHSRPWSHATPDHLQQQPVEQNTLHTHFRTSMGALSHSWSPSIIVVNQIGNA